MGGILLKSVRSPLSLPEFPGPPQWVSGRTKEGLVPHWPCLLALSPSVSASGTQRAHTCLTQTPGFPVPHPPCSSLRKPHGYHPPQALLMPTATKVLRPPAPSKLLLSSPPSLMVSPPWECFLPTDNLLLLALLTSSRSFPGATHTRYSLVSPSRAAHNLFVGMSFLLDYLLTEGKSCDSLYLFPQCSDAQYTFTELEEWMAGK